MNKYFLDSDIVKLCDHFSDRVISSNLDCYAKRKQFNYEKIKQDIFIGKLAEWGVFFIYLKRGRVNIAPPDMNIYSKNKKSFDPDMKWGLFNLHIKAQTGESANRYGDSWIFQSKDPLFEYSNEYDIITGCRVTLGSIGGCEVEILLEKSFKNLIFGDTRLSKFAENKKAVYLKDNE